VNVNVMWKRDSAVQCQRSVMHQSFVRGEFTLVSGFVRHHGRSRHGISVKGASALQECRHLALPNGAIKSYKSTCDDKIYLQMYKTVDARSFLVRLHLPLSGSQELLQNAVAKSNHNTTC
jgi:hypothetical protein